MKKNALQRLLNRVLGGTAMLTLLLTVMSVAAYGPGQGSGKSYTLKNAQAVSSGEEFSMPVWSPDGSKLLVASAHGMKLHLIDLKKGSVEKLSDVVGSGYTASWSTDGQEIYYRHKDSELQTHPEIKSIKLKGRQVQSSSLNPNGLLSASKAKASDDIVVFVNVETLAIEAETKDGSQSWTITNQKGQFYHPILSPDQKTVLVHEGSEMLLFAADGSGFIKSFGTGIASSWSPDSKNIIAFLDESSDGHSINGSELYMLDVEQGGISTLTATPGIYELWPNWSPDGKRIAFEDANSGNIYVADLVQQ